MVIREVSPIRQLRADGEKPEAAEAAYHHIRQDTRAGPSFRVVSPHKTVRCLRQSNTITLLRQQKIRISFSLRKIDNIFTPTTYRAPTSFWFSSTSDRGPLAVVDGKRCDAQRALGRGAGPSHAALQLERLHARSPNRARIHPARARCPE